MASWTAAHDFLLAHGRPLERRLLLGDAEAVRHAVLSYRNDDGGFGHAIEPDTRTPHSQPVGVELALQHLVDVGRGDVDLGPTCDWLASMGPAVPILLPTIDGFPRASHWVDTTYEPHVNPTASIAGYLHALGVRHPWVDDATAWTWAALEQEPPAEAHALRCALLFLEHVPERARAERLAPVVVEALRGSEWFHDDPEAAGYGVTPLDVVDRPDHPWAPLFGDLGGHLDRLERDQGPDGSWPITWDPPGAASLLEWRGILTLWAMRILVAHGRLVPEPRRT